MVTGKCMFLMVFYVNKIHLLKFNQKMIRIVRTSRCWYPSHQFPANQRTAFVGEDRGNGVNKLCAEESLVVQRMMLTCYSDKVLL